MHAELLRIDITIAKDGKCACGTGVKKAMPMWRGTQGVGGLGEYLSLIQSLPSTHTFSCSQASAFGQKKNSVMGDLCPYSETEAPSSQQGTGAVKFELPKGDRTPKTPSGCNATQSRGIPMRHVGCLQTRLGINVAWNQLLALPTVRVQHGNRVETDCYRGVRGVDT